MVMSASNQNNTNKWEELHKKSSSDLVRLRPNDIVI